MDIKSTIFEKICVNFINKEKMCIEHINMHSFAVQLKMLKFKKYTKYSRQNEILEIIFKKYKSRKIGFRKKKNRWFHISDNSAYFIYYENDCVRTEKLSQKN